MSYILDALRKSDLQRQRGTAPTLLAAQAAPAAPRRPALGVYVLAALLLLGAGVVIGWVRPWQDDAPVRHESIVVKPAVPLASEPAPAPATTGVPPQSPSQPAMQSAPEQARAVNPPRPPQAPALAESAKQATPERVVRAAPKVNGLPRAADADAPGSAAITGPTEPAPVMIKDLPLSIRAELPAMKFTVHAWSADPQRRLVGIDSRILREGDNVAPGLKLEQITPDGMIFDFKGYRFQRGVK